MPKKRLTPKQKEAVDFFKNHKRLFNRYPTFIDAGNALGIKPSVVHARIKLAEKKGIVLDRYKPKGRSDGKKD